VTVSLKCREETIDYQREKPCIPKQG
jgi:hypothetical protein